MTGWRIAAALYGVAAGIRVYRWARERWYAAGVAHGALSTLDMLRGGAQ